MDTNLYLLNTFNLIKCKEPIGQLQLTVKVHKGRVHKDIDVALRARYPINENIFIGRSPLIRNNIVSNNKYQYYDDRIWIKNLFFTLALMTT